MRTPLVIAFLLFFLFPSVAFADSFSVANIAEGVQSPLTLEIPFEEVGMLVRADLGGDGIDELIVSSGRNQVPTVAILRLDGSLIRTFAPYADTMTSGVTVTAGDITGDGIAEVVTGTMIGAGPHVRVFSGYGELQNQFFAYDELFTGGVNVATADIDGDGTREIVTAAGLTGGPHIRLFTHKGTLVTDFFAFDASDRSGMSVTRIDQTSDGRDELVIARYGYGVPEARIATFDQDNSVALSEPIRLYANYPYGVTLFPVSDELFGVAPNGHGGPHVRMIRSDGQPVFDHFAFNAQLTDRVLIASTGPDTLLSVTTSPVLAERLDKHIMVDISEQRLYAYEQGVLRNSFLISAGKWPFKTPLGEFAVMRKLRWHDYRSFDRAGNLLYNLPNVEFNLEFSRHFYIHYAYWHNNWGHPMSHGCVNAPYDGVAWVYNWAEVGTPVIVQE
ncbi:hypothetical protein COV06_03475 [Candidatus Uhrbacteria bacterium CG10_big_fil_rev_8_21_14_0_10_50_16]|uniref:L,D-TPase catalytic domain-containing protein n=1 Tax=Candidatus Uhrbacteria bacterium CG10_big_fil_rev_8_21_14_0_10_50_16 TaxID=1975039 RepID=A0A2H0RNZ0_9BACT|nr:MAG: hypothetical protein COV06_03475 [Candidatus Uhrbacteria bacterium CG10_big_fil_rev_8_21_14_0_10_50_16]